MSLAQIISQIQTLPKSDKIRILKALVAELAKEEGIDTLDISENHSIWTPINAFSAANTMLKALEKEEIVGNG